MIKHVIKEVCQNHDCISFCHSEEFAMKDLLSYMVGEEIFHSVQEDTMVVKICFGTSPFIVAIILK